MIIYPQEKVIQIWHVYINIQDRINDIDLLSKYGYFTVYNIQI